MIKRWGAENPSQVPEFRAKVLKSMKAKFGVEYYAQDPVMFKAAQKAMYKSYETKVGKRVLTLQGYEDIAVNALLKAVGALNIHECSDSFCYRHEKKRHVYHPDFELRHKRQSIVVEVKSGFTSGINATSHLLPEVLAKAKAVVKSGKPILLLVVRPLTSGEIGYDPKAPKGARRGRVTHFVFSTPKRPDWTLHSSRESKKELRLRLQAWLES